MKTLTGLFAIVEIEKGALQRMPSLPSIEQAASFTDKYEAEVFSFIRNLSNQKFLAEKIIQYTDDFFVAIDGHILNLQKLTNQYAATSVFDLIRKLYSAHGETFINLLEGDFVVTVFDKRATAFFCYSSYVGTYTLFHTVYNGVLFVCADLAVLTKYLRQCNIPITFSEEDGFLFLTHAHMLTNRTLVQEIKRAVPGEYLSVINGQCAVKNYYQLNSYPQLTGSREAMMASLDERMVYAVRSQYEKNEQYGYEHLSTLSGGLDSRMGLIIGKELGYEPKAFTFSAGNDWDSHIAKDICNTLGIPFQFIQLGNGEYLAEVERPLEIQNAQIFYSSASHSLHAFSKLDLTNAGIVNTGQIGDAIIGNKLFQHHNHYPANPYFLRVRSRRILDKVIPFTNAAINNNYSTAEIANMYNTGCNFVVGGNWVIRNFTELASPFLHKEVWNYCMQVPLHIRHDHRFYYDWIERYHPLASQFMYASKRRRTIPFRGPFLKRKLLNGIDKLNSIRLTRKLTTEMIPINQWFSKNEHLRNSVAKSFADGMKELQCSNELRTTVQMFFDHGTQDERAFAISLVYAYKLLFK